EGATASTLFPYTTLFRSEVDLVSGVEVRAKLAEVSARALLEETRRLRQAGLLVGAVLVAGGGRGRSALTHRRAGRAVVVAHGRRDRKSTRLNSSHVKISY